MLSRNLYILAGSLLTFSLVSYIIAVTGLAHEQGAPSDASLWRTIGIILLLIALVVTLLGVLQSMFEQADRRTPGGQAAVHQRYRKERAEQKAQRDSQRRGSSAAPPQAPPRT